MIGKIWLKIMWYILGCLGFYYLLWSLKGIDQGRAVSGIVACLMFGSTLVYVVKIPEELKKHQWVVAACLIYITGWFGYLWYITLKNANISLVTGQPTYLASPEYVGLFGIKGFWGIGVFVPVFIGLLIVMAFLVFIWHKCYAAYKMRQRLKRRTNETFN